MSETALTAQRILEAAEEVLRRYGPAKATVVDVARALEVSHGSVYRHFPSKAALREAVVERWLQRVSAPLEAILTLPDPAPRRLRLWFDQLRRLKRAKALDDPEVFAAYSILGAESRAVIVRHLDTLLAQLGRIIAEGMARGELAAGDPAVAARALLDAMTRFHKPAHAAEWGEPGNEAAFEALWALLMRGLGAG